MVINLKIGGRNGLLYGTAIKGNRKCITEIKGKNLKVNILKGFKGTITQTYWVQPESTKKYLLLKEGFEKYKNIKVEYKYNIAGKDYKIIKSKKVNKGDINNRKKYTIYKVFLSGVKIIKQHYIITADNPYVDTETHARLRKKCQPK